jgi:two-component system phosphate regulon sensor histidine kinase PhoR
LKLVPSAPDDLIHSAIKRMELQAERNKLTLTELSSSALPKVLADPQRIEQVLVNLIHNAIKFTPPGGKITISAEEKQDEVIFSVQDSGVGISPDDLSRVFERFYKTDRARSTRGTGLGLSIARHLMDAHKGKIWAESELDKGSTFHFSLPKA